MKSARPKVPKSLLILLWTLLAVVPSACVQAPPVFLSANACSELVPEDWAKDGVKSVSLPPDPATVGDWISFGTAQTGQLDKANDRTKDAVTIVKKCEARDRAAYEATKPKPWFQIW